MSLSTALIVFICVWGVSHAQQESQAERAMRKAQGMLRQLLSEKKALEGRNAELEAEVAQVKSEVARIQDEVGRQQSLTAAMAENNAALSERIRQDHQKIQEIIAKYRAKQTELRLYQHDHALLTNAVIERNEWISDCRKNNASLIEAGKELLLRYDDKSFWDAIVESEPVLGIGNVDREIENQEYRFKLEDLEIRPPESDAAPLKAKQGETVPQPAVSRESASP